MLNHVITIGISAFMVTIVSLCVYQPVLIAWFGGVVVAVFLYCGIYTVVCIATDDLG